MAKKKMKGMSGGSSGLVKGPVAPIAKGKGMRKGC